MTDQPDNLTLGTQVATCQHLTCNLVVYSGGSDKCILHDPDSGKDAASFEQAIREKIEAGEKYDSINQIDLSGVVFPTEADFHGRVFTKPISFGAARFTKGADFQDAKFGMEANFVDAEFDGRTTFQSVKFSGMAWFWNAKFGSVSYFDAKFDGEADFQDAKFAEIVDFREAEFGERASFRGATFNGGLHFDQATVRSSVTFQGKGFPSQGSTAVASFQNVTLDNPQDVRFENVDLSRVSFLRTDVSQVHFVGCTWPLKFSPSLWPIPFFRSFQAKFLASKGEVIYDELALDERNNEGEEVGHDRRLVADLYRQLRLNLEGTKQEVEAGAFYVGQMEMRRLDNFYSWHHRLLLTAYRVLATYGENYLRPFLWYAIILAPLYALAYWILGSVSYSEGLFSALTAGALIREVPKGIESWETLLVYSNMLTSIFLLGLTLIAFRRRFSR